MELITSFESGGQKTFGDVFTCKPELPEMTVGILGLGYFEYWRMYPALCETVRQDLDRIVERLRQEPVIEFLPGQETDNSRMLQQLQIRPKVRFATSDSRAAIAMVRAGLGITLLNDILTADLADGVAVLPLDPPQSVHLGIALPEEEHVSPAAKRFITYALDRLPELDVL